MTELCACGHENTHVGKRCSKPVALGDGTTGICPCQSGIRVDMATFEVMVEMNVSLSRISATLTRILAIAETFTGLQSNIVKDEVGRLRVDVQQRPVVPQILVPR